MILLFAGAGASAAIDANKYPTTIEFYKQLKEEIKSSMGSILEGYFNQYISRKENNKKPMDIEEVLGAIKEFKYDLSPCIDNKRISYNFMQNHSIMRNNNVVPYIEQLSSLEESIQEEVHRAYYNFPNDSDIAIWNYLINKIIEENKIIEIFTTNYDLILERVANERKINTGISQDNLGRSLFDYSFKDVESKNYNGRLTKLHGSVNWKKEGNQISVISNDYLKDRNAILYPGEKGIPSDIHFRNMHSHLYRVSGKAELAIFIGFSFRDDYINQILKSIHYSIPKIIVNIDSEEDTFHDDFPFTKDQCRHIESGFSKESVDMFTKDLSTE